MNVRHINSNQVLHFDLLDGFAVVFSMVVLFPHLHHCK